MKTQTKYAITFYLSIISTTAFVIFIILMIVYGKVLGIGIGLGILATFIIEIHLVMVLYLYMKKNHIRKEVKENE
jgi:archaellum biogenesis protein FlaJ (TadC family)